jgi:hypothetical protein
MHDKVSRLRALMAEAVPRPVPKSRSEEDAWTAYQHFVANDPGGAALDDSARAKAVRAINRIATWYGMGASSALVQWLDRAGAAGISQLTDDQVNELHAHMRNLEDCMQLGYGSPYAPAAE